MSEILNKQYSELVAKYPNLILLKIENKKYEIKGYIDFFKEYNNIPIFDIYNIKIEVAENYPKVLPMVYEIGNKISRRYEHFLDNKALCLGVEEDIKDKFKQNQTLLYFVDAFVISYLYSYSYYVQYGQMPFGERAHGQIGVLDYYCEKYDVASRQQAKVIQDYIDNEEYRGHLNCPCGSGLKIRNCKHKDIIWKGILERGKKKYE